MEKIKRFIECTVPVTKCNLKCSYCYIIQEGRRAGEPAKFKFSPEHIGKALSKERLGGACYISICGSGETLIPEEMPQIVGQILKQGHYVNITTNGTINSRIDEIAALPADLLKRLHFAFSFHYLELLRLNKLEDFFDNVKKVWNAGCSYLVQINLCDEYIPYLEEMKALCESKTGAAPQVAATRNELTKNITLFTKYPAEKYIEHGKSYKSRLFDFTMNHFMVKRKEFCYAGDWSFKLYLDSGVMLKCYNSKSRQNIFKNLQRPIKFNAIGHHCRSPYCVNASHFLSLGVIPELSAPSYADLRDRPTAHWYTPEMKEFLNGKLCDHNECYGFIMKFATDVTELFGGVYQTIMIQIKLLIRKIMKSSKKERAA